MQNNEANVILALFPNFSFFLWTVSSFSAAQDWLLHNLKRLIRLINLCKYNKP